MAERRQSRLAVNPGSRDPACVGASERKIGVGLDEVSDPIEVIATENLHRYLARGDEAKEPGFGVGSELPGDQVSGLGDNQRRRHEFAVMVLQQPGAGIAVGVVAVGGRGSTPVPTITRRRRSESHDAELAAPSGT